jgi:hypothetical protein
MNKDFEMLMTLLWTTTILISVQINFCILQLFGGMLSNIHPFLYFHMLHDISMITSMVHVMFSLALESVFMQFSMAVGLD